MNGLLLSFEDATKKEISDEDPFFNKDLDLTDISSNKMYKFLTLGILNHKRENIALIEQ